LEGESGMKKLLAGAMLIIILAVTGYLVRERFVDRSVLQSVVKEKEGLRKQAEELEQQLNDLENKIQEQNQHIDDHKLAEAFGNATDTAGSEDLPEGQETLDEKITNFFLYLDQKGYLADSGINDSSREFAMGVVRRLEKAKPVITGETANLYSLMKNITYFYRVLGKENLKALKTIIDAEGEIIEPVMALMFKWLNPWETALNRDSANVPPEVMYEYASFFLNTIAGQSYLFRRNSKIRDLVRYYSIIVVDSASSQDLNRYGIDLRPHINTLLEDMKSHNLLSNRDEYMLKLQEISGRQLH
jgi:hypothetical protein